jgi:hypothetical protein
MRNILIIITAALAFTACNKNKFTTAPQISFKSIVPNTSSSTLTTPFGAPVLTIRVTDAEGDIGFKEGRDTAKIFVKNLLINTIDSFLMPNIGTAGTKKFEADIVVNLYDAIGCRSTGPLRPRTDTTFFEVYVTDFAKNKSNVIRTNAPVFHRCL